MLCKGVPTILVANALAVLTPRKQSQLLCELVFDEEYCPILKAFLKETRAIHRIPWLVLLIDKPNVV